MRTGQQKVHKTVHLLYFCSQIKTTFDCVNNFKTFKISAEMASSNLKVFITEKNIVSNFDQSLLQSAQDVAFLIPFALFVNLYFRKSFTFAQNWFQLCFCSVVFLLGLNPTFLSYANPEICKFIKNCYRGIHK